MSHIYQENAAEQRSLPSSTILAGTASGLFQTTTTGTGVVTGLITTESTGKPIDAASISTTSGSSCLSTEGYYLLLLPAGVHTLQVNAPGHQLKTVSGITVVAGQSVSHDIALSPLADSNSNQCLATALFHGNPFHKSLALLQRYRDTVLRKTEQGRIFIDQYYRRGDQVWEVLQKHPDIKRRCLKLAEKVMPFVSLALSRTSAALPPSILNELSALLYDIEQVAPKDLQKIILHVRYRMKRELKTFHRLLVYSNQSS